MFETSLRQKAEALWHVQRVKRLVRDRLGEGAQCLVSVRETICTDLECAGPVTEIRIVTLGLNDVRTTVHKAVAEVLEPDIAAFL
ncbi:MAG: hypothetical protein ABJJ53_05060 [Sulfitobacter sp.]